MRPIDADALLRTINKIKCPQGACMQDGLAEAYQAVMDAPTIEAEPVRHGRWIIENEYSIRCSECCFNRAKIKMPMDYCPICGAKMGQEE